MRLWYQSSQWRNLVDMHIPDWNPEFMSEFDPERYAELMAEAGVDASELYTGNCLGICFFPTKVGHMHEGLKGAETVGPTLDAIRRRGMNRVAYFNLWSRWAYETHPDWRIRRLNGTGTTRDAAGNPVSRFGCCCLNSPGYRDYVAAQIRQLCEDYEFESLWIDMPAWHGHICYCDDCRGKYRRETGGELPVTTDWKSAEWMRFQRFRERSMTEMTQLIVDTAKGIRPDVTISFQSAPWQGNWTGGFSESYLAVSDFLAGDFYGCPLSYSVICKALNNMTVHRPFEFMISRCYDLNDHTSTKTDEELRFSACAALAHNAAFVFIDAINPEGTMDERLYRRMGQLKNELAPVLNVWDPESVLLSDVLFYRNFDSSFDASGGASRYTAQYNAKTLMTRCAEKLIAAHIPYDFIFRRQLREPVDRKKLLILSEVSVLDDEEAGLLRDFVKDGGRLIVTGRTGLYDRESGLLDDFRIADLLGVSFDGETAEDVTYIAPCGGFSVGPATEDYPLTITAPSVKVRTTTAETLATVTLPWSHSREIDRFGSAISNPPGVHTSLPAVTLNRYGDGLVMYVASTPEYDAKAPQAAAFLDLVRYMMPVSPLTETDAPDWVETMLMRDDDAEYRLVICNAMEKYYKAALLPFTVSLRLPRVSAVTDVLDGSEVGFTDIDGTVKIVIRDFCDFRMLKIRTE